MKNEISTARFPARLPQPLAGAMCCFAAGPGVWPAWMPWATPMAAMYEVAFRQAVEAQQSHQFFRRLEPSLN